MNDITSVNISATYFESKRLVTTNKMLNAFNFSIIYINYRKGQSSQYIIFFVYDLIQEVCMCHKNIKEELHFMLTLLYFNKVLIVVVVSQFL